MELLIVLIIVILCFIQDDKPCNEQVKTIIGYWVTNDYFANGKFIVIFFIT